MFDFDEWSDLYKSDPEEFERRRREVINNLIENAPIKSRNSMRLIQIECDTIRDMFTPLVATIKINELICNKLKDLQKNLNQLKDIIDGKEDRTGTSN